MSQLLRTGLNIISCCEGSCGSRVQAAHTCCGPWGRPGHSGCIYRRICVVNRRTFETSRGAIYSPLGRMWGWHLEVYPARSRNEGPGGSISTQASPPLRQDRAPQLPTTTPAVAATNPAAHPCLCSWWFCVGQGWYSSAFGASCDAACISQGLVCTEQGLFDHNSEVDSSAEIIALVQQHGGSTSSSCNTNYMAVADVPNWSSWQCFTSGSRPLSSFDCAQTTPQSYNKRRLCYCLESEGKKCMVEHGTSWVRATYQRSPASTICPW